MPASPRARSTSAPEATTDAPPQLPHAQASRTQAPRTLARRAAPVLTVVALLVGSTVGLGSLPAVAADAPTLSAPVINEVESNGDDVDWVELGNPGTAALDLTGYVLTDAEPAKSGHSYTLPSGTVIAPGGLLAIDGVQAERPGFPFGLGGQDAVRIYAPGTDPAAKDAKPLVEYAWEAHASTSYGRCPDLTGEFATTTRTTHGATNDCSSPLVINEVESDGGEPGDWVELYNTGSGTVDAGGLILKDNNDSHSYTLPQGTQVPAGGFLRVDESQLGFGLGKADSARLLSAGGAVLDAYEWQAHAATSYGRCPDGSGKFATTASPTPGAANACATDGGDGVTARPWPGGDTVRTLDAADEKRGDWSGLDVEPATGSGPGALWVVQNGDGELYRMDSPDAGASWARSLGFELRYPGGSGTVDAEGVTVTSGGSAAGVYVSTERDNDNKAVSRPAVLRYELPASATGADKPGTPPSSLSAKDTPVLNAAAEWNLAKDFPGLGANSGLEGISWIPDSWLTKRGFRDEARGGTYAPANYPGHGDGLFAVGVEGTGSVYLYALMDSGAFQRVATVKTGLDVVADVQFDADRNLLWAVCDDACNGRMATFGLGETPQGDAGDGAKAKAAAPGTFTRTALYERPAKTANFGNEGFAIAPLSACKNGAVPTYYADDNNTDGHSLRTGTLTTTCPTTPVEPTKTTSPATPDPTTPPTSDPSESAVAGEGGHTPSGGVDQSVAASETVAVTSSSAAQGGGRDGLAATGAEAWPWVVGGGALVLMGVSLLAKRSTRIRD